MRVLIDGDGCPVVDIAGALCRERHIPCLLLCDTAHEFHREGAETLTFDKGSDSVDYALVNRVQPGDLVITLGCGDVNKVNKLILEELERRSEGKV